MKIKAMMLAILFVCVAGCSDDRTVAGRTPYSIVKIDDCEYLEMRTKDGYFILTHKGDCSNPKHYENRVAK